MKAVLSIFGLSIYSAAAAKAPALPPDLILLEDFTTTSHQWIEMNDPVMGGQSSGTFSVSKNLGHMDGVVKIVPFLHAPGFIKVETARGETWPDVRGCEGLRFSVKTYTNYQGYRVSFGKSRPPDAFEHVYGYKSDLKIPKRGQLVDVDIPFDEFTDNWDAGTGDAIVTCADDKQYCPDDESKEDLSSIAIWGEGVKGKVKLEVHMIAAYGCGGPPPPPPPKDGLEPPPPPPGNGPPPPPHDAPPIDRRHPPVNPRGHTEVSDHVAPEEPPKEKKHFFSTSFMMFVLIGGAVGGYVVHQKRQKGYVELPAVGMIV